MDVGLQYMKKHPIKWKLGLITKYDEHNSIMATSASEDVQNQSSLLSET
jgi:hypothetical protein